VYYSPRKRAFWLLKKDATTILKNISCKKITESGIRREKKKKIDSFYGSIFGDRIYKYFFEVLHQFQFFQTPL